MKIRSILCLYLLMACNSKEEVDENLAFDISINQQWKLTKMTGGLSGTEAVGDEMEWQETYFFNTDLSFSKTRVSDGTSIRATGTFEIEEKGNELLLQLRYPEESTIAGSCFGQEIEVLVVRNQQKSLESTWLACDGPGLFYERQN